MIEEQGTREQETSENKKVRTAGQHHASARAEQEDAARKQAAALRARQVAGRRNSAEEDKEIYERAEAIFKFLAGHCAKPLRSSSHSTHERQIGALLSFIV
jgi:hypothetical protein